MLEQMMDLIHNTKDGGLNWTSKTAEKLPNLPKSSFVNDIKADLHDINKALCCFRQS